MGLSQRGRIMQMKAMEMAMNPQKANQMGWKVPHLSKTHPASGGGPRIPPREAIPMVIPRSFPKEPAPKYSPSMAPRMITESRTSHG